MMQVREPWHAHDEGAEDIIDLLTAEAAGDASLVRQSMHANPCMLGILLG